MADTKLSKIEKILLVTAVFWSGANLVYSSTDNPNENYLMVSNFIPCAILIGPIGKALYQTMRQYLKTK